MPFWQPVPGGVMVAIRLTPKGGRDAIGGVQAMPDGAEVLAARVSAPPHEGAANEALIRLLARAMGVPPRSIRIAAGATARVKRLAVRGEPTALAAKLEKLREEKAA